MYLYKINSLLPGRNPYETEVIKRVQGYDLPWTNPIDTPYITLVKVFDKLGFDILLTARFLSAGMMVLSALMFYQLLRNWLLSPGKALVGTVLFATSSWTLIIGRGGHSVVAGIFLLLLIFTLSTRLYYTTRPFLDWLMLTVAVALALYTPVNVWFIFLAGVVSIFHIRSRQKIIPIKLWQKLIIVVIGLAAITPIVLAFIRDIEYLKILGGVNNHSSTIMDILLNAGNNLSSIFFINRNVTPFTVGRMPYLEIFSVFMFLIGCYYFERRLSLKRSKLLFGGLIVGLIVCSLSPDNAMRLSIMLPIIYIFIAAGVHESITRWLGVFPKNPIARGIGIIVLSVAVGFATSYHLSKTYLTRPLHPQTRAQ